MFQIPGKKNEPCRLIGANRFFFTRRGTLVMCILKMDDFKDVFQFNLKIKDFQLAIFDRKTSYPILNPCKATSKYCCAPSTVSPENIQYQVREFFRLQLISKTLLKCVRPHLHNFLGPPLCLRIIGISSFPVTNCDFLFLSPRKSRFFTLPEIDIAPEK